MNKIEVARDAVRKAMKMAASIQKNLKSEDTILKKDSSPVTLADYVVQAAINITLSQHYPEIPISGEENSANLKEKPLLLSKISAMVCADEELVCQAIDRGNHPGGKTGAFWVLDPIDGTKGFLRGGQYAIALALIENAGVCFGILGCPNFKTDGALFYAIKGKGSYLETSAGDQDIHVDSVENFSEARYCESHEKRHSSHSKMANIAKQHGITHPPLRMDSQCKYAVVAEGEASFYFRFPSKNYEEKIWDHAAGSLLVEEAGGRVSDVQGRKLDFSQGITLKNNKGIIASNNLLHEQAVAHISTHFSSTSVMSHL